MTLPAFPITNFAHLQEHDEQLLRLGLLAEKYFADDPNTCLLKLLQLAELLTQLAAAEGCGVNPARRRAAMKSQNWRSEPNGYGGDSHPQPQTTHIELRHQP